ncbi:MAG: SusC/RagA family TonB-linked outer membrane protein [Porphyromonadaceae bacterium]|nr:SusC/RagA family TonB-linked outer membrane protein [Porphyromonadaceae bacterium]
MIKITPLLVWGCLLLGLLWPASVAAQTASGNISGKVYEIYQGKHEPAVGINVSIENSQNRTLTGVATDANGAFSVKVPADAATIVFSFIGMETQRIPYTGQKTMTVVMENAAQDLGEVTIAAQKAEMSDMGISAREATTATQKIDMSSVVETLPVSSVEEALQGRLAGVDILSGGDPGSKSSIRIRGTATLNSNTDPLIVINGVPYSTDIDDDFDFNTANNEDLADMLNLNPYDIESVEVLKDAASTAIYGTKASNGVLLITTKKGAKGKTNFTFSSKFTVKVEPESMPMLTGDEYVAYMQDAIWNTANAQGLQNSSSLLNLLFDTPEISYMPTWRYFNEYNVNTDWLSKITKNAWIYDDSFSMSGGGEKATYRFSLSYMNEGGTSVGTDMDRITANYNLTYRFSNKFDIYSEFSYTDTQKDAPYLTTVREESLRKMPNKSPYWIDPDTGEATSNYFTRQNSDEFQGAFTGSKNYHPIIMANDSYNKTNQREERIIYRANYQIIPSLKWTGYVSMKFKTIKTRQFLPQSATDVTIDNSYANYSYDGYSNNLALLTENKFIFRKQFGVNGLTATALWRTEQSRSSESAEAVYGAAAAGMSDPIAGGSITSLGSGTSEVRTMSAVGMVNYTLFDRYTVNVTVNGEGRSSLSKAHRWGLFPAVGAAWQVQDEEFMQNLEWWSQLKLRASWGQSGNAPSGTAPYVGTFSSIGDYNTNAAIAPSTMQLNNLKWETSTEYDLGADLGFMDNKLTTTFDYYHKITKDLLQKSVKIPGSVGYSSNKMAYYNSGTLSNIGWEWRFDYEIFKNKDWTVSANFNINRNVNKIIDLPDNLSESSYSLGNGSYAQLLETGVAVGAIYGFRYKGVYQNTQDTYARDAEGNIMYDLTGEPIVMKNGTYVCYPGDAKYEDMNHDGKIDEKDIVYLGNYNPLLTGGGGFNIKWKGLTLTVFLHYRIGAKIINSARMDAEAMYNTDNQSTAVLKRWRSEGDVTDIPRALYNYGLNYLGSDRFVEDCSFVRLKTLSLSYAIPKPICKKMKINSLSFFVTGYDLLTFTNYKGQDPEVTLPSNVTDLAEDTAQTPRSRRFSFGFNLNF